MDNRFLIDLYRFESDGHRPFSIWIDGHSIYDNSEISTCMESLYGTFYWKKWSWKISRTKTKTIEYQDFIFWMDPLLHVPQRNRFIRTVRLPFASNRSANMVHCSSMRAVFSKGFVTRRPATTSIFFAFPFLLKKDFKKMKMLPFVEKTLHHMFQFSKLFWFFVKKPHN